MPGFIDVFAADFTAGVAALAPASAGTATAPNNTTDNEAATQERDFHPRKTGRTIRLPHTLRPPHRTFG